MTAPRFGFVFDMRNATPWLKPAHDMFVAHLDFIAWTESIGFRNVWFAEHHGSSDGYLPSPLIMAAAAAARTRTMRIGTCIALAPFYHPVRLAEDVAVLDILSGGRFDLALALGYVPSEADRYGNNFKKRARRTDDLLQIVRRLWQGESFDFESEFFQLKGARISPLPISKDLPIWVGGNSAPAYRRAAKYGDGFFGPVEGFAEYAAAVEELGDPAKKPRICSIGSNDMWHLVSEDPEQTIEDVLDHIVYQTNTYAEWMDNNDATSVFKRVTRDELRPAARTWVMTPDASIDYIKGKMALAPIEAHGMMAPSGYPLEKLAVHAQIFADKVMPAFA